MRRLQGTGYRAFDCRGNTAAIERFCEFGEGGLTKLASRILGVEAEHQALGRDVAGKRVPNNLCLERAPFTCVSEAADALPVRGPLGGDGGRKIAPVSGPPVYRPKPPPGPRLLRLGSSSWAYAPECVEGLTVEAVADAH